MHPPVSSRSWAISKGCSNTTVRIGLFGKPAHDKKTRAFAVGLRLHAVALPDEFGNRRPIASRRPARDVMPSFGNTLCR
jgi:hypothetical protein